MPKTTETGLLKKACRNARVMSTVIPDAYESGNPERAAAALQLLEEFAQDVHSVLDPLLAAGAIASAASESLEAH